MVRNTQPLGLETYLDSSVACSGGKADYQTRLFYVGKQRRTVRSTRLVLGSKVPDQDDPARVFRRLRKVAARTAPIPAANIAAVSLERICAKRHHEQPTRRIERVAAFVVARSLSDIPLEPGSLQLPGFDVASGQGRALPAGETDNFLFPIISLPLTAQEAADNPANFVLRAYPKLVTGDGPYAAIHGEPGNTIETIVRYSDIAAR